MISTNIGSVREAEHDVVAARPSRARDRLDGACEERIGDVADDRSKEHRRSPAKRPCQRVRSVLEVARRGQDPLAGSPGRSGTVMGALLRIRETVLRETPVAIAMSFIVDGRLRRVGPAVAVRAAIRGLIARGCVRLRRSIGHSNRRRSTAWIETEMRMTAP